MLKSLNFWYLRQHRKALEQHRNTLKAAQKYSLSALRWVQKPAPNMGNDVRSREITFIIFDMLCSKSWSNPPIHSLYLINVSRSIDPPKFSNQFIWFQEHFLLKNRSSDAFAFLHLVYIYLKQDSLHLRFVNKYTLTYLIRMYLIVANKHRRI